MTKIIIRSEWWSQQLYSSGFEVHTSATSMYICTYLSYIDILTGFTNFFIIVTDLIAVFTSNIISTNPSMTNFNSSKPIKSETFSVKSNQDFFNERCSQLSLKGTYKIMHVATSSHSVLLYIYHICM